MATTSSFTPLDSPGHTPTASLRSTFVGALDGMAFGLPVSLGSATLVFSHLGLEYLPAGLFALLLAMAWMHASTSRDRRPQLYAARFFEATTLAALIDQVIGQLPAWGLQDTGGVRLAFLCLIGASAGMTTCILYLVRADRFTRLIPSPVFVGFSNSIALALLLSQTRILGDLFMGSASAMPALTIAAGVFGVSVALRYLRPRWPATTIGLVTGLLMGLLWAGTPRGATPMLGAFGWWSVLPFTLADFSALAGPQVRAWPVATAILADGAILGTMMFINTTMSAEFMSQADGRRPARGAGALLPAAGMTLAGLAGSVPISGSMHSSLIAARNAVMSPALMLLSALVVAGVYLSGLIGLIPLAAVCGALLCEAWFMMDRGSLQLLWRWLRRQAVPANGREDLALIAAVTATAVLLNMVAAVFVGLLFGLVLFAARNAKRPVRNVWTGLQLNSNCARSRGDLRLLAEHGGGVHVVELEGDLFFGAIESLEHSLEESLIGATSLVIDWSRVRHVDTSVARCFAQFERLARGRGLVPIHAGIGAHGEELGATLFPLVPFMRHAADLDRALEQAENEVIQLRGEEPGRDVTTVSEAAALFQGLDEAERASLEAAMVQQLFRAGETIMRAGEAGDELMLVLHGSASVVLQSAGGVDVRVAGVRRGATIGDIAFLDRARRSASVVAEEDTTVAVLSRQAYDALCLSHPRLVQRLLSNIALNLAARLRHTNRLALTRQGQH